MSKQNKQTVCTVAGVLFLIALAAFLRIIEIVDDISDNISFYIRILRAFIYIGLFSAWGFSLRCRIIHTQTKRYFTAISALTVLWMTLRTLKFIFFADTDIGRYLWYLYYVSMIFIPLLASFIALSLGKSEDSRLTKHTNILFGISVLFVISVLTNDIHQFVFGFPKGLLNYNNGEYTHRFGYYLIIGWILLCTLITFVVTVLKCRVPYSKRRIYLPCIPLAVLVLYAVLYLTAPDFIHLIAGDMTVTICLLTAAILESFIQCGLIQSNTHYALLFECTGIHTKISDENYSILLPYADTEKLSKDVMRRSETAPVLLENGVRLCSAPIKNGRVLWFEDVSEITEVISELADSSEYLTTRKTVLHKKVETRMEEQRLTEQNRLYNRLMNENKDKYALFSELIAQLEATDDAEREKKLTAKLAVVCTHIKRRGNLIFLTENGEKINPSELRFALEEWITNLRLCEVRCNLYFGINSTLTFSQTIALYDTFQHMILHTLDTLRSLLVTADETDGKLFLILNLSCDCDLSEVAYQNVSISDEDDGEWIIKIDIPKGGAVL